AGLVPAALGSDTGGSIRQPAHWAGVVGLKPSYGAVSRWGLVAHASSLDCVGVLARSVEDAGAVFAHMQGGRAERDWGEDETCGARGRGRGEEWVQALGVGSSSFDPLPPPPRPPLLTVGVVAELWQAPGQDQGMRALLDSTLERLTEAVRGTAAAPVRLTTVSLPSARLALPAYYVLSSSEASANLARYDGILYPPRPAERVAEEKGAGGSSSGADALTARRRRASLGAEALRRVLGGTYCLREGHAAATYHQAHEIRKRLGVEAAVALEGCDVLLAPVAPGPAPLLEEERAAEQDPLHEYAGDLMTVLVNLAGLPAVAVPAGLLEAAALPPERGLAPKTRLPAGLQVVGRRWDEQGVLRAARILEETCWGVTGAPLAPVSAPV
ncbi:amidase, partial [Helicosporidium sp. ATCC 50920]